MFARLRPLNWQFNQSAPDKIVGSLNESATPPGKQNMETTEMTDPRKSLNATPHLCRSKVKQTALEIAAALRPANKFSRVGLSFVERIEAKVRIAIREEVRIHTNFSLRCQGGNKRGRLRVQKGTGVLPQAKCS
jgi:hypothetical protein